MSVFHTGPGATPGGIPSCPLSPCGLMRALYYRVVINLQTE